MSQFILAINPGSTSTKISIYDGSTEKTTETIRHAAADLAKFEKVIEQKEYRLDLIKNILKTNDYNISEFSAIVGRGGLLKPISSGTYLVDANMLTDLTGGRSDHASNLGAILAFELSQVAAIPAFIVDPVVVDEMMAIAKYTGSKLIERQSIFHALNQKAVARATAKKIGKKYEESNFIVAHLGGGISVGAHLNGLVVDTNNALDGDGPFSPERTGSLPAGQWLEIITSGKYDKGELKKLIKGQGGIMSYFGTADCVELEKKADGGSKEHAEIREAMAYQISKEIGGCAVSLSGKVDRIIITGGVAYDKSLIRLIEERTGWISQIEVIPGENEMEALVLGAKRVLDKEEEAKKY